MRSTGAVWEAAAQAELERAGLRLIARNWNCRHGELDLIMRDADTVVFVEVRYRSDGSFGDGTSSIGPAKRARLIRAAELFLAGQPALARCPCRFDTVAFSRAGDNRTDPDRTDDTHPRCDWQRDAFDAY